MALKEDYKDAVFAGLRKYKMLDNGDGTVSPVDMTEYEAAGDKFGAKDVNAITKTVNATGEIIADDGDEFKPDQKYVIGRIVIYDNKTWRFKVDHEPGEWDESQVERTNILTEIAEQNKNFEALNEKIIGISGEVKYGYISIPAISYTAYGLKDITASFDVEFEKAPSMVYLFTNSKTAAMPLCCFDITANTLGIRMFYARPDQVTGTANTYIRYIAIFN